MPKHKEHLREYNKEWRKNHLEYSKKRRSQWRKDNPERIKEIDKKNYQNNKEKRREENRQYAKNHPEYDRQWKKDNPEKVRITNNHCYKKRYRKNLKFKIGVNIKNLIKYHLKKGIKNNQHWEDLVDYKKDDLIKHLQKTISKGYCWQDYMRGELQIDHIIPQSVFNFDSPDQIDFKRCWALENLRLIPAKENMIKHNKLTRPFQPALKI